MILNEVIPGVIWQSDLDAAKDLCVGSLKYRAMGPNHNTMIRGVICAAFGFRLQYDRDISALLLPQHDNHDVPPSRFDLAVNFHHTFGPTLVHCHAGRSRSVAYAAAIAWSVASITPHETFRVCDSEPEPEVLAALMRWLG